MTLLLSNDDVERALTAQDAIAATETIYRELAEGKAVNRPRSQTYMPVESEEHPGFNYRFKSQEGSGVSSGVWALRVTSDMAGDPFSAGVKRRRILPIATGKRYCGLVILFDLENLEPIAIMPDGVIQKFRVAALSVVGARYLAPAKPKVLGLFGSGWQASAHLEFLANEFAFEDIKIYSPNPGPLPRFSKSMSTKLGHAALGPREAARSGGGKAISSRLRRRRGIPCSMGIWSRRERTSPRLEAPTRAASAASWTTKPSAEPTFMWSIRRRLARLDQSPDVWDIAQNGIIQWDSIVEVQDLVAGKAKGRTYADQITVFNNNTGAGTQFAAVGSAVLRRAREMKLGRELPTEWFLEDVSP